MIPLNLYILVSTGLFSIGIAGVVLRRNTLVVLMSLELILNASNLALVAAARAWGNLDGQIFVFFTITVAAAEVAVGLAILVALFRRKQTVQMDDVTTLKL